MSDVLAKTLHLQTATFGVLRAEIKSLSLFWDYIFLPYQYQHWLTFPSLICDGDSISWASSASGRVTGTGMCWGNATTSNATIPLNTSCASYNTLQLRRLLYYMCMHICPTSKAYTSKSQPLFKCKDMYCNPFLVSLQGTQQTIYLHVMCMHQVDIRICLKELLLKNSVGGRLEEETIYQIVTWAYFR